jgi:hypothetical protein
LKQSHWQTNTPKTVFISAEQRSNLAELRGMVLEIIKENSIDIELHTFIAQFGLIYHIDDCLGVYRLSSGISSLQKHGVNENLVSATSRVFEGAFVRYPEKHVLLKRFYAKAMLNYSYQAAVLKNSAQFKIYIKKSINISVISVMQVLFYLLPTLFVFWVVSMRNSYRKKII